MVNNTNFRVGMLFVSNTNLFYRQKLSNYIGSFSHKIQILK